MKDVKGKETGKVHSKRTSADLKSSADKNLLRDDNKAAHKFNKAAFPGEVPVLMKPINLAKISLKDPITSTSKGVDSKSPQTQEKINLRTSVSKKPSASLVGINNRESFGQNDQTKDSIPVPKTLRQNKTSIKSIAEAPIDLLNPLIKSSNSSDKNALTGAVNVKVRKSSANEDETSFNNKKVHYNSTNLVRSISMDQQGNIGKEVVFSPVVVSNKTRPPTTALKKEKDQIAKKPEEAKKVIVGKCAVEEADMVKNVKVPKLMHPSFSETHIQLNNGKTIVSPEKNFEHNPYVMNPLYVPDFVLETSEKEDPLDSYKKMLTYQKPNHPANINKQFSEFLLKTADKEANGGSSVPFLPPIPLKLVASPVTKVNLEKSKFLPKDSQEEDYIQYNVKDLEYLSGDTKRYLNKVQSTKDFLTSSKDITEHFKPYSLKDYQIDNKVNTSMTLIQSLGSDQIGTKEWIEKNKKQKKVAEYGHIVKFINDKTMKLRVFEGQEESERKKQERLENSNFYRAHQYGTQIEKSLNVNININYNNKYPYFNYHSDVYQNCLNRRDYIKELRTRHGYEEVKEKFDVHHALKESLNIIKENEDEKDNINNDGSELSEKDLAKKRVKKLKQEIFIF